MAVTTTTAAEESAVDFDEMLSLVGDRGTYQLMTFLLVGVMQFVSVDAYVINFLAAGVDHWCFVPQLHNLTTVQQRLLVVPLDDESRSGYSRCWRYDVDWSGVDVTALNLSAATSVVQMNDSGEPAVKRCQHWTYDHTQFTSTIVSRWDLVCERAWLVDLVSTVYMLGRLVACLVVSLVSDRFGRKAAVLVFHAVKMSGCLLSIYAPSYELFTMSRFIVALGSTAAALATFLIVSEVSGIKWRGVVGVGWNLMISIGTSLMPALAYFVRDYQRLLAIYTWPQFALFSYAFILDESPRWLASRGQHDRATRILRKIARINKRPMPTDLRLKTATNTCGTSEADGVSDKRRCGGLYNLFRLVSTPKLRLKTVVICLNWFIDAMMFYALSLNASRLPGSVFLNTFLLCVVEIPANLAAAVLLERVGRRLTVAVSTVLGGLASLSMIPFMFIAGGERAVTAFAIVGKGFITVSYSSIYVVTTDNYPTSIRAAALGLGAAVARAGNGSVATSTVCDIRHIRHHFRCARVSASGNTESATANDSGRSGKPRQPEIDKGKD